MADKSSLTETNEYVYVLCQCSSTTHRRITHRDCPFNPHKINALLEIIDDLASDNDPVADMPFHNCTVWNVH